jgi:hypothetical protein
MSYINVLLWQKFGKEILDFDKFTRMGKSDILFTGACRPGPGGLSAASARTIRAAPAAAPVPSSF